jgi:hypothetical protein
MGTLRTLTENFKDFVMERQDFGAYVGSGPREKSNSSADLDLLNRNNFSYCALLKIYSYIFIKTPCRKVEHLYY